MITHSCSDRRGVRPRARLAWALGLAIALAPRGVLAVDLTPQQFQNLTNGAAASLVETFAVASQHRSLLPASSLGLLLGIDAGFTVGAVTLPDDVTTALRQIGVLEIPSAIPVPKLVLAKGLPFGFDVAASYFAYDGNKSAGAELKWAFINPKELAPAFAIRATHTVSRLFFLRSRVTTVDLMTSISWHGIQPYGGGGVQILKGSVDATGGVGRVPVSVNLTQSANTGHLFFGVPARLLFLTAALEYDYSFLGVSTLTGKVSFTF